jgi:DNA-binding NarL/FixJ family response regulator
MTTDQATSAALQDKSGILLVDDHPIVREGLAQLINAEPDLMVCAEASTGRDAMNLIRSSDVALALVDISLQDCSGVELIKDIVAVRADLPCLALSMYDEALYAMRVLRAGGRGYIMKQEVPKKVLGAIRQVLSGNVYLSETMATRLVDQVFARDRAASCADRELSDRELAVLMLIGRGLSTREIAEQLFLSVKTVESHCERMKEKLKLKNRLELLRYAMQFTLDATAR